MKMDYGMTIRTHRKQISYRVHFMFSVAFTERIEVMDVDEPGSVLSVILREIEIAYLAFRAMDLDTPCSQSRIALIPVYED